MGDIERRGGDIGVQYPRQCGMQNVLDADKESWEARTHADGSEAGDELDDFAARNDTARLLVRLIHP